MIFYKKASLFFFSFASICLSTFLGAQNDGTLDNSFHGNGKHTFTFHTGINQVYDVDEADPNAFYILSSHYITKIDSSGAIDNSFGTNGLLDVAPILPNDIAIGNNRLYIGGWDSNDNPEIQCFFLNGAPDNSFGTNSVANPTMAQEQIIYDIQIDNQGRLVVAGRTDASSVNHDMMIFRMLSNGTVDSTFGTNGLFTYDGAGNNDEIWKVDFQSDGKLICAGELGLGTNATAVLRLNVDGTLDNTFGINGRFSYSIIGRNTHLDDVVILDDDRIRITGPYDNTTNYKAYVIGLTASGSFDNTFAGNGRFTHPTIDRANSLMLQPDGKLLVAALDQVVFGRRNDFAIMRLNANGTLDNLWGGNGSVIYDIVDHNDNLRDIFHLSGGKILGIGSSRDDSGNRFIGMIRLHNSVVPGCAPIQTSESLAICPGDSALVHGSWMTLPGSYPQTLQAQNGCDSVHTVQLNTNVSHNITDVRSACNSFTWIDGVTYTQSTNLPMISLVNSDGCDSILQLDLTIHSADTATDIQTACGSFTWVDGVTYTQSNSQASILLQTSAGCDSTLYLDLTILQEDSVVESHASCNSYTWINGVTYQQSVFGPSVTLTNNLGCDSLVILDLTIDTSVAVTDVQSACGSYTWIDGVTYSMSTNTPTFLLQTTDGCDSLITLDLTILQTNQETDVITACGSHPWIDGVTYYQSTFGPSVTLTNVNGCDSIVVLDLTVNPISSVVDSQTACGNFTWINGVTYNQSISGETVFLTSSNGCDSTLILDLVINQVDTSLQQNGLSLSADPNADSWQWIDCNSGQIISGASSSTYVAATNGSFASVVTSNSCTDTTRCVDIQNFHIEQQRRLQIRAYPNPFESVVQLELPHNYQEFFIEVLDSKGSRIRDFRGNREDLSTIQIEDQGSLFILKIFGDGQLIQTIKLIRE